MPLYNNEIQNNFNPLGPKGANNIFWQHRNFGELTKNENIHYIFWIFLDVEIRNILPLHQIFLQLDLPMKNYRRKCHFWWTKNSTSRVIYIEAKFSLQCLEDGA